MRRRTRLRCVANRVFAMPRFALLVLVAAGGVFAADGPSPVSRDTLPAVLPFDKVPLGLPDLPVPKDNPLTAEKVALGRKLFFDPILSGDKTVACASCHLPEKAFGGGAATSRGIHGLPTKRKAPSLVNRAYGTAFFWDGRAKSLEEQALIPIEDPAEMGTTIPEGIARLTTDKEFAAMFAKAFPDEAVSAHSLAKAIASFERVLLHGGGPVD